MNSYIFSLQASCNELVETINKSCKNNDNGLQEEIHYRLGTAIHWIMDCWDRIEKTNIIKNDEYTCYMRAFRCIANELKHNPNFVCFHIRISDKKYPYTYPYRYGKPIVVWNEIRNMNNPKYANQLAYYKKYIEDKEIEKTILRAKEIIESSMEEAERS